MEKMVRFIRHAESVANAGAATSDPALIPLTEYGHVQSRTLSDSFDAPLHVIVCSPFRRVQQTAAPTLERFPQARVEIWPIHEFTYLSPPRCTNTTPQQRRPMVEEYWKQSDPDMVDGPGAESFRVFIERVRTALLRLTELDGERIVVFGHGQFLQAIRWLISNSFPQVNSKEMRLYRECDLTNPIKNGGGFCLRHEQSSSSDRFGWLVE